MYLHASVIFSIVKNIGPAPIHLSAVTRPRVEWDVAIAHHFLNVMVLNIFPFEFN